MCMCCMARTCKMIYFIGVTKFKLSTSVRISTRFDATSAVLLRHVTQKCFRSSNHKRWFYVLIIITLMKRWCCWYRSNNTRTHTHTQIARLNKTVHRIEAHLPNSCHSIQLNWIDMTRLWKDHRWELEWQISGNDVGRSSRQHRASRLTQNSSSRFIIQQIVIKIKCNYDNNNYECVVDWQALPKHSNRSVKDEGDGWKDRISFVACVWVREWVSGYRIFVMQRMKIKITSV